MKKIAIVWFRQDLRLTDHLALTKAVDSDYQVLPLYILDDKSSEQWKMGAASSWWLHQSLAALNQGLEGHLCLQKGNPEDILSHLIQDHNIEAVFWHRCYEPWCIARDTKIKQALSEQDIHAKSFNGSLLYEPHTVLKQDGTPYKVFTPFYQKGCLKGIGEPRTPLPAPTDISFYKADGLALDALDLMPSIPWYQQIAETWRPGEVGAHERLSTFIDQGLQGYKEGRNLPAKAHVSRLSPHLHFGEISPNTAWYATRQASASENNVEHFLSELGWREFSHYLLFHFPKIVRENLQSKFDAFPWRDDPVALKQWQQGMTGYPIVDAGMRELWQTGYMHNRVRMIVGSFLVKNLLIHWHHGEDWFWDTLLDADLANNSASWQWIAGCGADAAPYFRIFNPVTQGQKFDPEGEYVATYIPELARLPNKYIHCPWEAPSDVLAVAGITLGVRYPHPMVNLKASRERALEAFQSIKGSNY